MDGVTWSADGSHLFAVASSEEPFSSFVILSIDLRGNLQVLTEPPAGEALSLSYLVASPDGHYLAYKKRTNESNVMMLEHF
jgi:Tol biopolymer transport system component